MKSLLKKPSAWVPIVIPLIFFAYIIIIPFFAIAATSATSEHYLIDQGSMGFVELQTDSDNYDVKAAIGLPAATNSTSANYEIKQGRVWALTQESSSEEISTENNNNGGGGGGGGSLTSPAEAGVSFNGRAYPLSTVRLLKDGQVVGTTIAGPDALFSITLSGINVGSHVFVIVGLDKDDRMSQFQPFTIEVTSGFTTQVGGIFLSPTLAVDKKEVHKGDNLAIFGQTVPESEVTIGVASDNETFHTVNADNDGVFLYNLDTALLVKGDHETRAKSAKDNSISDFSRTIGFVVGEKNIPYDQTESLKQGDLNGDDRVNIIDFSIAGYWYKKTLNDTMRAYEATYLNGDGIINIIDLSIMAFYWTG
ncbi:MAG: dockerin type I repeat-containing protein [Patescibacteria group bacterium]|nr:dockerin type I repeat-containing protein [Patescibacteria group bacterium]MDD5294935.1 dockerin type I repeat-containing protein [Patescibacteria group bacterium]MDD5554461.1 dockerin type I repeat-containing protein [Patescibacteria group bacterium]